MNYELCKKCGFILLSQKYLPLPIETVKLISQLLYYVSIENFISHLISTEGYIIRVLKIHLKDPNRPRECRILTYTSINGQCKKHYLYGDDNAYPEDMLPNSIVGMISFFDENDEAILKDDDEIDDTMKITEKSYLLHDSEYNDLDWFIRRSEWLEIGYHGERLHVEKSIMKNLKNTYIRKLQTKIEKNEYFQRFDKFFKQYEIVILIPLFLLLILLL